MTGVKPSSTEEEYFAKEEAVKLRKLAVEKANQLAQEDKQKLKELHYMRCPKCGMELQEIVFKGVNVDKCFSCHGIYLDDGELEELAGQESGFIKGLRNLFS